MKYFTALLVIMCLVGASVCEGRLRGSRRRLGFIQNGWNRHNNAAIKYGPQIINGYNKWGGAVKHCINGICGLDTMDDEDEQVGGFIQNGWNRHNNAAIKYGPQIINGYNKWGGAVKHCINGICGLDTMDDEDEQVGGFIQNGWNRHTNAAIKYGPQIINGYNKWGGAVKHCINGICGLDTMDDQDEQVGSQMPRVPYNQPSKKCPAGEYFSTCLSSCPSTCTNPFPRICNRMCNVGCGCVKGYVRDTSTNKCIPLSYCPKVVPMMVTKRL